MAPSQAAGAAGFESPGKSGLQINTEMVEFKNHSPPTGL